MVLRIGNAQGFWGDQVDAPASLVHQAPNLDYLTLDYLSEVSMSIMAIQQDKDSTAGYARDFVEVVRSLAPYWKQGLPFRVITNAGGLNPEACADTCLEVLRKSGLRKKKIGVVLGDNVLHLLKSVSRLCKIRGFDVVELAPIPGIVAPDFMAAKLIYRLMGYITKATG